MPDHLAYQLKLLNLDTETALKRQILDQNSPLYGAVESPGRGCYGGENGSGLARAFILAYYTPGSAHYRDSLMLERCGLAVDFVLRQQKSDGTFDLKETNFHDGAQTAFIVTTLAPAVLLMRRFTRHTPEEDRLYALLMRYVNRSATGIVDGGFHTPNHRWVLASALSMCRELTGREDCLDKMRRLLDEGIDCDEEGEYTERSSGVYNIICDRAFIILAEVMGMTELYDTVARNLRMIIKYIEPDLTVNTMNSTRQDAGTMPDWRIYYGLYLYMAAKTGDREFRYIADMMLEQSQSRLSEAGLMAGKGFVLAYEYLPFALMNGCSHEWDPNDTLRPAFEYTKLFKDSGILRHRKGDLSLTLVKNNPVFALIKYKSHTAYLRLAGTFYAQGQFVAESLEPVGAGYRMIYARRWGYKSPLPERQATSDWRKMDHSKRSDVMMQDFVFNVDVNIIDGGAEIHIFTEGVESVLIKFEIMLEPGHGYRTHDAYLFAKPGDYALQGAERAVYEYNDYTKLMIDGGGMSHTYAEHMRGSIPGDAGSFTVAMTFDTPMDRRFTLKFEG